MDNDSLDVVSVGATPFVPDRPGAQAEIVRVVVRGRCRQAEHRAAFRAFVAAVARRSPDLLLAMQAWLCAAVWGWATPKFSPLMQHTVDRRRWIVPRPAPPRCGWSFGFPTGTNTQHCAPLGEAWSSGAVPHDPPLRAVVERARGTPDPADDPIRAGLAVVPVARVPCCHECGLLWAAPLDVRSTVRFVQRRDEPPLRVLAGVHVCTEAGQGDAPGSVASVVVLQRKALRRYLRGLTEQHAR